MENATYTALTRQSGLMREMQAVAHNIANLSTDGYRKGGLIFAEHVAAMEGGDPSLSMATATVRNTSDLQGPLTQTGDPYDLAIEGDGFFQIETPQGNRLTRAGSFTPNESGELVNMDGYRLLDQGGTPIFIPPNATAMTVARDGTVVADGVPLAQIGLVLPADPTTLSRQAGVLFSSGPVVPTETATMLQGFIENSNVDPILEIARMIEVQRAYELGQSFLSAEDERVRGVIQTLGR